MKKLIILFILSSFCFAGFFTDGVKLTDEGGVAIKLTNRTITNSVKGMVVQVQYPLGGFQSLTNTTGGIIGVVYTAGIASNVSTWVVIRGIVDVLMNSNTACSNGFYAYGYTNGSVILYPSYNTADFSTNFVGIGKMNSALTTKYTNLCRLIIQ